MKKAIFYIAQLLAVVNLVSAQVNVLENELTNKYILLDTAKSKLVVNETANALVDLANKNPAQWLAQYYASYAKCLSATKEENSTNKDMLIDEAEVFFNRIESLKIDNEHVQVLKALIAYSRLSVAPQKRFVKYGKPFYAYLDKAKELNPNNPQIHYLKGVSLFYTPKMFGGGMKNAKPHFDLALQNYASVKNKTITIPYWGETDNRNYLNQIALELINKKKGKKKTSNEDEPEPRLVVLVTLATEKINPDDLDGLMKKEMEFVETWRNEKVLESFALFPEKSGAMLVFKNLTLDEIKKKVESLPFFPYMTKVEYSNAIKHF